jgi:DNA primase
VAFPANFLDEIRARVGLADLIGRRVRLAKKGREFSGLCPFHSEKSPSFTVVEDKGFFHCFGCGAHGDAIGFVMRTEGLSFPEAVERLAQEAGLAMPEQTPFERETARREADLYEVLEAACRFFEERLAAPVGRTALDYLRGRGLDEATIARFRLGYAPDARQALKGALMSATRPERLLLEAGLLIKPEGDEPAEPSPIPSPLPPSPGRASYDRFRGRVTFPIADRRGRVIAFGARILGDGQPKYLNSPETPVFHKGEVLYGLAQARKAAHDTGRLIVVEGYMDVIGMSRGGFPETVAPLGTALTERQLAVLWRIAPEPILCFDGDAAGWRASVRAAERALPLLEAGRSLGFVTLPKGEDPDTFVARRGRQAMADLLRGARPLNELVWEAETAGRPLDTPERLAALESRLEDRARAIPDRKVQFQYLGLFRQRLRDLSWASRSRHTRSGQSDRRDRRSGRAAVRPRSAAVRPPLAPGGPRSRPDAGQRERLHERILLATLLNHPALLGEFAATLGKLNLEDPRLDRVRREILLLFADQPTLDANALGRHLNAQGLAEAVGVVLGSDVFVHAGFARPESPLEAARAGFRQTLLRRLEPARQAAVEAAARAFGDDPTDETKWLEFERLKAASTEDDLSVEARQAEFEAQVESTDPIVKSRTRA